MIKFFLLFVISTSLLAKNVETYENAQVFKTQIKLSKSKIIRIELDKKAKEIKKFRIYAPRFKRHLNFKDKKTIKRLLGKKYQNPTTYKALHFLNMMPVFYPVNRITKDMKRESFGYEDICHMRGKKMKAKYTYKFKKYSVEALIGDKKSKCPGLCGKDCKKLFGRDVYTRECLDHDICHRKTRSFFGCFDELIKAAYGQFFGKEC
jgi:hypothetical protein